MENHDCYGMSMVFKDVTGCYGKFMVATERHWLLWEVTCMENLCSPVVVPILTPKWLLWKVNGWIIRYWLLWKVIWAASRQNQHSAFATSMDPDQPAHPRSLIRIHAVRLPTLLQEKKLIVNSMDPDQPARMHRLVRIHAGRKPTMLVLSWRGSFVVMERRRLLWEVNGFYNQD
jgi:hypothetical protein